MNSLDVTLVAEIIRSLKLADRIKMRLVAKRYKQMIDMYFPVHNLVLTPDYDFYNRCVWLIESVRLLLIIICGPLK